MHKSGEPTVRPAGQETFRFSEDVSAPVEPIPSAVQPTELELEVESATDGGMASGQAAPPVAEPAFAAPAASYPMASPAALTRPPTDAAAERPAPASSSVSNTSQKHPQPHTATLKARKLVRAAEIPDEPQPAEAAPPAAPKAAGKPVPPEQPPTPRPRLQVKPVQPPEPPAPREQQPPPAPEGTWALSPEAHRRHARHIAFAAVLATVSLAADIVATVVIPIDKAFPLVVIFGVVFSVLAWVCAADAVKGTPAGDALHKRAHLAKTASIVLFAVSLLLSIAALSCGLLSALSPWHHAGTLLAAFSGA